MKRYLITIFSLLLLPLGAEASLEIGFDHVGKVAQNQDQSQPGVYPTSPRDPFTRAALSPLLEEAASFAKPNIDTIIYLAQAKVDSTADTATDASPSKEDGGSELPQPKIDSTALNDDFSMDSDVSGDAKGENDDFGEADEFGEGGMDDEFEKEFNEAKVEIYDPLEPYNRFMTDVNDWLFLNILDPVARGYAFILHEEIRRSIRRFFDNAYYPVRGVNNLLQGKLADTGEETGRFLINTTIGIGGLFDPAQSWFGLEAHPEDFGQTLGRWGAGPGPHFVWPIYGPSNLRDTFGEAGNWALDGWANPYPYYWQLAINWDNLSEAEQLQYLVLFESFEFVNKVSLRLDEYQSLKKDAVDWYPFLRDLYEANRRKEIER